MINEQVGNPAGVKFVERRKWDTKTRQLASVDRAHQLIGYQPSTPFKAGLESNVNWFKINWDLIEVAARFGPDISSTVLEAVRKS